MYGRHVGVQQAGAIEFAEDAVNAACAMHVFDMVFVGHWRDLAQARHLARNTVDVGHREIDAGFLRRRQNVQHGIGRAAHRHVERHGVLERGEGADGARQDRSVVVLIVTPAEFDDLPAGLEEELLAVGVRGQHRAVAGQRKAERFGQAVHRVGGEHAGARAAGRAGRAFDIVKIGL